MLYVQYNKLAADLSWGYWGHCDIKWFSFTESCTASDL